MDTERREPTLWERTRNTFEHILAESQKATERIVDSLEEISDAAKARLEKARLERALLRRSAELGTRVYELSRQPALPDGTRVSPLDDARVKTLLKDVAALDADLDKLSAELEAKS